MSGGNLEGVHNGALKKIVQLFLRGFKMMGHLKKLLQLFLRGFKMCEYGNGTLVTVPERHVVKYCLADSKTDRVEGTVTTGNWILRKRLYQSWRIAANNDRNRCDIKNIL